MRRLHDSDHNGKKDSHCEMLGDKTVATAMVLDFIWSVLELIWSPNVFATDGNRFWLKLLLLLADGIGLAWLDSPPQTCDVMVIKPEVARLDLMFLCSNSEIVSHEADFSNENTKRYFEIVSHGADLGEENSKGYSAKSR